MALESRTWARTRIELVRGDITHERVDAIVNAANTRLAGGGGVDGAIHRAGGPTILEACRRIGGCPTGEARLTEAGRLHARWVVHAVGPVYRDGRGREAELLANAYRRSLTVAVEAGARSIAFPSISTGAYGYPIDAAAGVALETVRAFILSHPDRLDLVRFVLFSAGDHMAWVRALATAPEPTSHPMP